MRNLLLIFSLIVFGTNSNGQTFYAVIDTNNIASGFNTNGAIFCKDTNGSILGSFKAPKSGSANAIYAGSIWAAGLSSSSLYISSTEYGDIYQPGPANLFPQDSASWNYIWAISRAEVLAVKNDFDVHHNITQPIPNSLLTWPAKGNASAAGNGGVLLSINQDMAPFVDRNGDGIYNVYDGDYPLVRGDKMLWFINSDNRTTNQNPMGIDRRYSIYEYNCAADSNLANTLFMSVTIKNQSSRAYDSVLIGAFIDFDLGCPNNDRTGSIPSKNSFYTYNGFVAGGTQQSGITCDEGVVCPTSAVGYGCELPIVSATFLNDTLRAYTYFTNGAPTDMSDPTTDVQYYNYLSGRWNDATPLTYGGNGLGGNTVYPYAFPGNPADASQWSECNQQTGNAILANDRRSLGSIGFFSLAAGDTLSFDMALIFHPGPYDNCPDVSDSSSVVQHIDSISKYYATETFPCWFDSTKLLKAGYVNVGIHEIASGPVFGVIPNPSNGNFNLHISNANVSEYAVTITDMLGRVVYRNTSAHAPDQAVQLTDVTKGVYTVSLEAQNYKATKKIIITK